MQYEIKFEWNSEVTKKIKDIIIKTNPTLDVSNYKYDVHTAIQSMVNPTQTATITVRTFTGDNSLLTAANVPLKFEKAGYVEDLVLIKLYDFFTEAEIKGLFKNATPLEY